MTTRASEGTPNGSLKEGKASRRFSRNASWATASRSVNCVAPAFPQRNALAVTVVIHTVFIDFWVRFKLWMA